MENTTPHEPPVKLLRRSSTNRMIAGVCGGIGAYFRIDPVLVRVVFVILALVQGFGLLLYIVLAIIVPRDSGPKPDGVANSKLEELADEVERRTEALGDKLRRGDSRLRRTVAWIIIIVAAALLIGLFRPRLWGGIGAMGGWYPMGIHWGWGMLAPLLLVLIGIYLILRPPKK